MLPEGRIAKAVRGARFRLGCRRRPRGRLACQASDKCQGSIALVLVVHTGELHAPHVNMGMNGNNGQRLFVSHSEHTFVECPRALHPTPGTPLKAVVLRQDDVTRQQSQRPRRLCWPHNRKAIASRPLADRWIRNCSSSRRIDGEITR